MSVDCQVAFAVEIPLVFVVHPDAHQVRHDIRQAVIVIAFHPYNLDLTFWIGELADVSQKMPPSRIKRLNDADFSIRNASEARLTSEPRCRSERIIVSAKIM